MPRVNINMRLTPGDFDFRRYSEREVSRTMEAVGQHMTGAVKRKLTGQRTGKSYRVPGTRIFYVASRPGEAPAVRHGHLRNSIDYRVSEDKKSVQIGTHLKDYPAALEFGTRDGKIQKRPFIRPAFEQERLAVLRILRRRWRS